MQGYDSMDERRRRLLEAMRGQAGGRLMGNIGGPGRRRGAGDMAPMGVPGLTFNPFMAQLSKGQMGLHGPSRINSPAAPNQYAGAPMGVGAGGPVAGGPQAPAFDPFANRDGGRQFFDGGGQPPAPFYGGAQAQPTPLLGSQRTMSGSGLNLWQSLLKPKPPLDPTATW